MAEVGIDIAAAKPKILTDQAVRESDVVITMGCGDTCPFYPGKRYEDWVLDDPAGKDVAAVRPVRDDIRRRVKALLDDLVPAADQDQNQPVELEAEVSTGGSAVGRFQRRRGNQSGQRVQRCPERACSRPISLVVRGSGCRPPPAA